MTPEHTIRIGLIQMQPEAEQERSMQKALDGIHDAARRGAQVVCLPELFLSPYFCQKEKDVAAFDRAESVPGPATEILSRAARDARVVLVGGSLFERAPDGTYYNTAPVFESDGSLLGAYRKTHIPHDSLFYEQHYFAPGDSGYPVFRTTRGRIAVLICYDQWFPEAARAMALNGAEIIFYPTAIGTIDDAVEENITGDWERMWTTAQMGQAACNNVFVAPVNRVGKEGAIQFWGGSFVADPAGAVMRNAGDTEQILIADADLSRVSALQEAWGFFHNRRPETYHDLTKDPLDP